MAKGLPQYGGEGDSTYKGNKSDMNLKQFGGEGQNVSKKGTDVAFTPGKTQDPKYCGPGRYLKTESF